MELHLLQNRCKGGYVSFGSCWSRGETTTSAFVLRDGGGRELPAQHEITAYWPDGSVKWACHTADSAAMGNRVTVEPCVPSPLSKAIAVTETADGYNVDTGGITLRIPKAGGDALACDVRLNGHLRMAKVRPVFDLERRETGAECDTTRVYRCQPQIDTVDIEVAGPVLLVVKYTGMYWAKMQLMPFTIRMTVGLDSNELKFENTFFYNGLESRDYVKGMGLHFDASLTGMACNRHIKLGIDSDSFHEMAQYLYSYRPRTTVEMRQQQVDGEMIAPSELVFEASAELPVWDRYALTQLTADSFRIGKQTKKECCMIDIQTGHRAPGSMAVTGEDGGILIGMKDFWQRFPSGLEVDGLAQDTAACYAWFRSPQAEAMDYRHYDTRSYWLSNYEGYPDAGPSADGIATTSECFVRLVDAIPTEDDFRAFTARTQKPAVYVGDPAYYHAKHAFGRWSLPCMDTPEERQLEKLLDQAIAYYKNEIEERRWYGLYDYGDVMHSYDEVRHCWKYDFGGCAWQNTELVPTYWLWLYFMRTGREDVFTLAEAMSRHCSETDVYHFGPMKGIGSRHNIRHWGCACKEPRVSMAGHHRPMYYLTGDRRLGDYFDEVLHAPESLANLYFFYDTVFKEGPAQEQAKLLARTGPDWAAFVSDWATAYERTLDESHREKILRGLEGIKKAPMQLASGPSFAFDPKTGDMAYNGEYVENIHLTLCMGGPQIWLEIAEAIDCPELYDFMADYGKLYLMTPEERNAATNGLTADKNFPMDYVAAALAAFSAQLRDDADLAARTWETLMLSSPCHHNREGFVRECWGQKHDGTPKQDVSWIATNYVAQWCLNIIMALEFIRDSLPSQSEWDERAARDHNIPK